MFMKKLTLFLFLFSFMFQSCGVRNIASRGTTVTNCLFAYIDSSSGVELTGYKSLNGDVVIPAKYFDGSDTLCQMALVLDAKLGFVGIDQHDSIILVPFIFDNGPDYVEEGLFRFVEKEKIGFANLDGQKIIPAKYDFATPFVDGISTYSIGGERMYDGKTRTQIIQESGEEGLREGHWVWGGAVTERGYLNKCGDEFVEVTDLHGNERKAWTKDKKHLLLDKDGRILKTIE